MLIDYEKKNGKLMTKNPCYSPVGQRLCSWWGAQDYRLLLVALHFCHWICNNPVFSEVTELAEIAHEVIFYLNGLHSLD